MEDRRDSINRKMLFPVSALICSSISSVLRELNRFRFNYAV